MKSRTFYIIAILAPLAGIYLLFRSGETVPAVVALLLYAFIYRPYVDSLRLYRLGAIDSGSHRRWMIPFGRAWWYAVTHFRQLFWGRGK